MYNGIGLPTPRGSGTNGYVQRNLAHVRKTRRMKPDIVSKPDPDIERKPNQNIILHQKKREIEAKCLMLKSELEDEGWREEQIEREVNEYRKRKLHELTEQKDSDRDDKLKRRLGISKDYVEGSSVTQMKRHKTEQEVKVEPKVEPKVEIKKEEKR